VRAFAFIHVERVLERGPSLSIYIYEKKNETRIGRREGERESRR